MNLFFVDVVVTLIWLVFYYKEVVVLFKIIGRVIRE